MRFCHYILNLKLFLGGKENMATLLLLIIYLAFISLGLPDALLGASWPVMQPELNTPFGFAGIIQMLISGGTIVSSLLSGLMLKRFGTGKVTSFSVALTAGALLGFSLAPSFLWVIAAAIPLGLGAGAVDAGLNAYVANHYESRHMSWLHSFWGIGALGGPLFLSMLLPRGFSWRTGYGAVGLFQIVLVVILLAALPLWGRVAARNTGEEEESGENRVSGRRAMTSGKMALALTVFLFYCGIEASLGLWGGSFLVRAKGLNPAAAAAWVSFFFASLTLGRFLTGFLTRRWSNDTLIRRGVLIILGGVLLMVLPLPRGLALAGFLMAGLGCAPVFPSMLHETPVRFGRENSQAVMGFQMAAAYVGSTFLPPLFGLITGARGLHLLPFFLLGYGVILLFSFQKLSRYEVKAAEKIRP